LTKLLHPELEDSSLDAIRKWKDKPARLNGSPIAGIVEIEMNCTLRR
jgi:outer membrane biosynthesis protein TonB